MRRKTPIHKTVHHHHYYGGRRRFRFRLVRAIIATIVLYVAYKSVTHGLVGAALQSHHY
ncbi:hypothetical protein [Cupriavidus sp. UYPR2.512]|uniref:hypothetical protein n=1 Tax=Cupriavidus sp. UYPR2.512 TaxID=1080187 RepID=UPI00039C3998|nr:hypothetical protein [Cupriavidus sp. UYPR2.512]UIF89441.1 hypothetical protein KAF44_29680 [Cupriavidus necator]